MVDHALFFMDKITSNKLSDMIIPEPATSNRGLLGHSVGAGLCPHVASQAAKNGQGFTAVHVMAPQTEVDTDFAVSNALNSWPAAYKDVIWAIQFGEQDILAPPKLAKQLVRLLVQNKLKVDFVSMPAGVLNAASRQMHVIVCTIDEALQLTRPEHANKSLQISAV